GPDLPRPGCSTVARRSEGGLPPIRRRVGNLSRVPWGLALNLPGFTHRVLALETGGAVRCMLRVRETVHRTDGPRALFPHTATARGVAHLPPLGTKRRCTLTLPTESKR